MVNSEEIRDEVESEMASLMHTDARATKSIDSETLRAPISDLEMRPLLTTAPDSTVAEAVQAMVDCGQGCILVCKGGNLVGIFTERDVLTRVVAPGKDPASTPVSAVMSADPKTLTNDLMIAVALNYMDIGGYRHVPIVDEDGNPTGVLSVRDVLRYLAEFFPEEVLTVSPAPNAVPPLYGG